MSKSRRSIGDTRRRGQALLLAIIVLLALALLGAAMIAVVSAGLQEGSRDEAKVRARLLAEAGIKFADDMLSTGSQAGDWRPVLPAYLDPRKTLDQPSYDQTWDSYEVLRGWDPQHVAAQYAATATPAYFVKYRFAMAPDALSTATETTPQDDPSQDFVISGGVPGGVVPVENVEETAPHDHFLLRVEFAPNPSDPLSKYLKITSVGRPGDKPTAFQELVAYKPLALQDYLLFIHDAQRTGGTATLGQPAVDVGGSGSTGASNRAGGTWTATGANDFVPLWLQGPVRCNSNLQVLAPARIDPLQGSGGWQSAVEVAGSLSQVVDPAAGPAGVADGNAEFQVQDATGSDIVFGRDNTAAPVTTNQPRTPAGTTWPTTLNVGTSRVEAPALDNYEPVTGVARYDRLTKYSGNDVTFTVNSQPLHVNTGQLGYGAGIYVDNTTQVDLLATAQNSWLRPETWGGRRYIPNGCLIELLTNYPDELTGPSPAQPVIAITRTDGSTWTDPSTGKSLGQKTLIFDWPAKTGQWQVNGPNNRPQPDNGLLVCEGNVRIFGRLPQSDTANGKDYNLTVVSRGTIYIDGPLLRPSDYTTLADSDKDNTRIALLAHDNVVLNPTALNAGPVPGMPSPPYSVPPDAPTDSYFDLDPSGTEALGVRATICRDANGQTSGAARRVTVIQADGNANDGKRAYVNLIHAQTRSMIGRQPDPNDPPAAGFPYLARHVTPGRPGEFSQPPSLIRSAGVPVYFADWANYARAIYPCGPGGSAVMEYFPDSRVILRPDWNYDPANAQPGVPSYDYVTAGGDLTGSGGTESQSDVIVKNLKIEKLVGDDTVNDGDNSLMPRPGQEFHVSALLFAERGSLYIVPGDWFDPRVTSPAGMWDQSPGSTTVTTGDIAAAKFARLRRYNYRVSITGAIAVNQMPSLNEVGAWVEKWCYPSDQMRDGSGAMVSSTLSGAALFNEYDAVRYQYDWGLRSVGGRPNLPRLPALPASPGLIYVGEENKR